jgi:uncharacterized membrane protein YdcZ (DUF606 family)
VIVRAVGSIIGMFAIAGAVLALSALTFGQLPRWVNPVVALGVSFLFGCLVVLGVVAWLDTQLRRARAPKLVDDILYHCPLCNRTVGSRHTCAAWPKGRS